MESNCRYILIVVHATKIGVFSRKSTTVYPDMLRTYHDAIESIE